MTNPTGIDTIEPRLSWELLAGDPAGKRWTGSIKRHNKQRKEVNMGTHTRVLARFVPLTQKTEIRGHFMPLKTKEQDVFNWC